MRRKFLLFFIIASILLGEGIKNVAEKMALFYRAGNMQAFEREKAHLLQLMRFRSRSQTRWPSQLLLEEATARGDFQTLRFLYNIDRENYKVSLSLGLLSFSKGKLLKGFSFLATSTSSYLKSPEGLYFSIFFFSKLLLLSFLGLLFFLSLSLLFKHSPLLYHDLQETWGSRVPGVLLFLAAIALPMVFLPGYGFLLFFLPAIFSLYAEENYTNFLAILLLIVTVFASLAPATGRVKFSPTYRAMKALLFYDEDDPTLKQGEQTLRIKWDNDLAYYLAYSYSRRGNLAKAVELYEKILKKNPNHVKAMVALAKIRFMSQEYPICLALLKKAYSKSKNIIPLYDLAYVLESIGNISEASRYSSTGWKEFGRQWGELRSKSSGFLDLGWNSLEVFWKAYGKDVGGVSLPPVFLASYFPFKNPSFLSPFLPGFLIFLLGLLLLKKIPPNIGSARYCQGCGKPICERCSEYYYKGYCEDCMNMIQLTRGDMSSSMSMGILRKRRKYEFFTLKIPSFFSYFFPGSDLFASGKFTGWALSTASFMLLLGGLLSWNLSLPFSLHLLLAGVIAYLAAQIYIEIKAWR